MKIFKTPQYPTEQKFLLACENYKIYLQKRGRGENLKPRSADNQIRQYVGSLLKAEKTGQEPPTIEWINLTIGEHRKKEEEEKRREDQEKWEKDREKREAALRKENLQKAAEDPEFKRVFIREELTKAGITTDRQVEEMIAERYEGKRNQDFWNERRRLIDELETEIKEAR